MKFKMFFSVFMIIFFCACSVKDNKSNDSRQCSFYSEDKKSSLGTKIHKSSNDDCSSVYLYPCYAQVENNNLVGEVKKDKKNNTIFVCLKGNDTLPVESEEEKSEEIDLSESLKNDNTDFVKELEHKRDVKKQKTTTKQNITKDSTSKRSQKQTEEIKKNIEKPSTENPVYKISLGPFFRSKIYVPYSVKIDIENTLQAFMKKYPNDSKSYHYKFIAYFLSGKKIKYQAIAAKRAQKIIQYAAWKGKVDMSNFNLILKPTKDKSQKDSIDIFINLV